MPHTKPVLIVGKSFGGINKYLTEHDLPYIILNDASLDKKTSSSDGRVWECNFGSDDDVKSIISTLPAVSSVVTIYENYVRTTAKIARHFGLPGLSEASAIACSDKERMREAFATAPKTISPEFTVVRSKKEVENFAKAHEFPLILKPANLAKSLLVTKAHSMTELLKNYEKTIGVVDDIYKKYAPGQEPKLIVEEFLEGTIHSVDAFVDNSGVPHVIEQGIVDYQTGYDIGYDDNFHYSRIMPTKLSAGDQASLIEVARLGCQALGMTGSPAHIEIIMTKHGPRIVEIGARNGGYRERMYRLACGVSTIENALAIARGDAPNTHASRQEPIAVLELFPKISGHFIGLENEQKLRQLPSLNYLSIKARPGEFVGSSSTGHKMCAVIILLNTDKTQFAKDLNFVNKNVYVKTNGQITA